MATQTLELEKAGGQSTKPSKLNPSVYLTVIFTLLSWRVMQTNSLNWAVIWTLGCLVFWVGMQTLIVRVFLHADLTHNSIRIKYKWMQEWCLWWSRSGMVKWFQWAWNHAKHHVMTDTPRDSYTPNAYNIETGSPPLPKIRFWHFWDNGVAYTKESQYLDAHPDEMDQLATLYPDTVGRTMRRLAEFEWARGTYDRVNRALMINWGILSIIAFPLARMAGRLHWLTIPFANPALAWAMIGISVYLYLLGGYIINREGHMFGRVWVGRSLDDLTHLDMPEGSYLLKDGDDVYMILPVPHQSTIPLWLMLLTFFMMGEGWHMFHHDAPFSARMHPVFDPGWWFIWTSAKLGLIDNITVASRVGPRGSRQYKPRAYRAWHRQFATAA